MAKVLVDFPSPVKESQFTLAFQRIYPERLVQYVCSFPTTETWQIPTTNILFRLKIQMDMIKIVSSAVGHVLDLIKDSLILIELARSQGGFQLLWYNGIMQIKGVMK